MVVVTNSGFCLCKPYLFFLIKEQFGLLPDSASLGFEFFKTPNKISIRFIASDLYWSTLHCQIHGIQSHLPVPPGPLWIWVRISRRVHCALSSPQWSQVVVISLGSEPSMVVEVQVHSGVLCCRLLSTGPNHLVLPSGFNVLIWWVITLLSFYQNTLSVKWGVHVLREWLLNNHFL